MKIRFYSILIQNIHFPQLIFQIKWIKNSIFSMDWILLLALVIINVLLCHGLFIKAEFLLSSSRFSLYNHKKSSRDLADTIFISVGTSSQCTVLSDEEMSDPVHPYAEKRYFNPRFGKLMCAASLNGGNVIDHFVKAGLSD